MKLVAVVGSPRQGGNTDLLVGQVVAGARAGGAEAQTFHLQQMNLEFCRACDACQGAVEDPCVIQDDMQAVHQALRACDAFVVGTPIYWFGPSAQTKVLLDRWYALAGPEGHALTGKKGALVMAYGDPDPLRAGANNAYRMFRDALDWVQVELAGVVHGAAMAKGEIAQNTMLLQEAFALGQRLCG